MLCCARATAASRVPLNATMIGASSCGRIVYVQCSRPGRARTANSIPRYCMVSSIISVPPPVRHRRKLSTTNFWGGTAPPLRRAQASLSPLQESPEHSMEPAALRRYIRDRVDLCGGASSNLHLRDQLPRPILIDVVVGPVHTVTPGQWRWLLIREECDGSLA